MKTKTMNLNADYVDFKRNWQGDRARLLAEVGAQTKKGNITKVNISFDFDCLQWIIPSLKKVWLAEKESREQNIRAVDRALGI